MTHAFKLDHACIYALVRIYTHAYKVRPQVFENFDHTCRHQLSDY